MELNLKRPLLFFDIESTGLSIASDCIIELSFVKVFPDGEQRIKTWKVKPLEYTEIKDGRGNVLKVNVAQRHISESASAVNGVYDKDLEGCPTFPEIVDEVVSWLEDSDLAGFNSAKFDLPLLAEEIERVNRYTSKKVDIDLHSKKMVDVQVIYHKLEPRNLKAAYRFYCGGEDFDNAHTAEADTVATYEVLKGQLAKYPETQIKNDVSWLANFSEVQKTVDYAGRIIIGENGEPTISFGKHRGKTCREVYMNEPSYFAWIDTGEFTLDTKNQFSRLKKQFEEEKKAAKQRPLSDDEIMDAGALLSGKFSGRLF